MERTGIRLEKGEGQREILCGGGVVEVGALFVQRRRCWMAGEVFSVLLGWTAKRQLSKRTIRPHLLPDAPKQDEVEDIWNP